MEKKALGRGLSALIPEKEIEAAIPDAREEVVYLPISQIKPSMYQPRTNFDETKLQELVASIKDKGIVQPILVRKGADGYELIAGERRFRAAKEA
ncbi:MAG: ParB/RepB/Spo0J family partition protein, partial [Candidatus Omnitrophica bacterium]|nr:ParB/RepB/Spo0J family partition protein [Candidatus Omnitrophota bacterium]